MPYRSYVEVVPPDLSRTLERSSRLAVRQRVRWCARSGGGNAGGGERAGAAAHVKATYWQHARAVETEYGEGERVCPSP
jgi:hypothetical protein